MVRILIADDHAIVREGLKRIVAEVPDLVVAAEAGDGEEALEIVRRQSIDLVILDLSMPRKSGAEALRDIKREWPALPVLILSMHSGEQYAKRMIQAGAAGYLSKESAPDELINAIRKILAGGIYERP